MKRHVFKMCITIRVLISTLQFTTSLFVSCNELKTVVVDISFRASECYCLELLRKVWDVISVRHSVHTLILLQCLFPVSFCSVLKMEIQHTKCDRVLISCSDDLLSANDWCVGVNLSAEMRHVKFELCCRFVWTSLAPAENSDLWFLNLSYFVRAVSRTLVLEFLSCRASPVGVLPDACWGYGGQRSIFDQNLICLKTWTASPAVSQIKPRFGQLIVEEMKH
jgi:hypothetical protein